MSSGLRTVAVIGGGITGLAAAHRLQELSRDRGIDLSVRVFEKSARAGGKILTERVGDFLLEAGPDQFVQHKPGAAELCRRLGLADELIEMPVGGAATYVVSRGRPVGLPPGFTMMGPTRTLPLFRSTLLSWKGKLRSACEPFLGVPTGPPEDESLGSFVRRRFGSEMLDRIFEPILGGIFTADADRMSLEMTMPQLLRLERQHGSLYRAFRAKRSPASAGGKPRVACLSLRGGLGRLIEALVDHLPADWIETSMQVDHLSPVGPAGRWRLRFANRRDFEADAVVLACPSFTASRLLAESDRELADDLSCLEYAACATVNLAYPRSAVRRPLVGLGFFVGRAEGLPLLACSHVSIKYPDRAPGDQVLLRAFLGGARDPAVLRYDDEALRTLAHDSLSSLLNIEGEPSMFRVHRFPSSMPQFPVGFRRNIQRLQGLAARRPGLILGGGSLGTVGLPDCIASGESAAGHALDSLSAVASRSFPAVTRA